MTQRDSARSAAGDKPRSYGSSPGPQSIRHSVMLNGERVQDGICFYEILVFDGRKQWSVLRRYSDFLVLHTELRKTMELPAMPRRSYFRMRFSELFRHRRYTQLGQVLTAAVAEDPNLHRVSELISFLRRKEFLAGTEFVSKGKAESPLSLTSEASTAALTSNFSDSLLGAAFVVGQRVQMKDDDDAFWYTGIIASVEPLEVAMESDGENGVGHHWASVRHPEAEGRGLKTVSSCTSLPSIMDDQVPQGAP